MGGPTPELDVSDLDHRRNEFEYGRRQFVVADPNGYLLRFSTSLGRNRAGTPDSS
jgi:hypothetical protein